MNLQHIKQRPQHKAATEQNKRQMPFKIQKTGRKKKKSILSQKMKQKKSMLQGQLSKDGRRKYKSLDQADNQIVDCQKPKQVQSEQMFNNINYIALEQFQGVIQDERTLQTYQKAIKSNSHIFVNKIILHLTTGCNCFYSIYAAEAGAAKVYCVVNGHNLSQQQNIWMMKQIIKENQLQHVIQVLSFKDFNAQIDVIIGQPMGYCMHYDGMLDRMIEARDLYLDKENGVIFPDKLKFKCAFIKDEHFYDKKIEFWNQVYGIPMKTMQKWISHQPLVKIVDPTLIVSEIKKFIQFDLNTISYQEIEQIQRQFSVKVYNKTQSNGLTIWFEIQFNCEGQKIQLKASPWQNATKFTHVTLYTSKKLDFQQNEDIRIKISGKKYPQHGVSLMKVNIVDKIQSVYTFS